FALDGTLSTNPPLRSSSATTLCPRSSNARVTCAPINPAPPVTKHFATCHPSSSVVFISFGELVTQPSSARFGDRWREVMDLLLVRIGPQLGANSRGVALQARENNSPRALDAAARCASCG